MKKGVKTAIIAAAVCIAAGCVLMGAGAAAGGRRQLAEGDFNYIHMDDMDLEESGLFSLIGRGLFSDGGYYDGEKETKGVEVLDGNFEQDISYNGDLKRLEIKIGVHGLEIVESGGREIHIEGKNCDRIQCYVKDGTLYVQDVGKHKRYTKINNRELVLTVPEGICWEKVNIDTGLGYVNLGTLEAEKAELTAELGTIEIEKLLADQADIEAEMGSVEVEDASIGKLDVSTEMGNVELRGSLEGDADVEANMGNVMLDLSQNREDFNYEITAGMGSVTLDGADYSGMSREKKIDNGAKWKMELNSSMGSIDIYFE